MAGAVGTFLCEMVFFRLVVVGTLQDLKQNRNKTRIVSFTQMIDNSIAKVEKVEEELQEFHEASLSGDPAKAEAEFGDVFFALINYARFRNINPEEALERTNRKFIRRFQYLENAAANAGKSLRDMTLAEMDVYWNEAKRMER